MTRRGVVGAVTVAILLAVSAVARAQLPALRARVLASGFSAPLEFVQDPLDPHVQFVVQKAGLIRVVVNGVVQATPFLDMTTEVAPTPSERGLLGLAFPPDHAASRRFYIAYTNNLGDSVVARVSRPIATPLVADKSTLFPFRWGATNGPTSINQPFDNHNGGHLEFGPDGYLYVGMGDGGSGDDPNNNAQTPTTWLGKLLRLDVGVPDNNLQGYAVPADNPFVDDDPVDALPEIWSFGWRNPWKFTFDDPARGGTGAMVIADVGQGAWEELDYEPANAGGRNYGWRRREGRHNRILTEPAAYLPLTEPFYEYGHPSGAGRSITGGYVYRGTLLPPAYCGRYFFADFITGQVWSLSLAFDSGEATIITTEDPARVTDHTANLGGLAPNISSFGVDSRGELYVVSYGGGRVVRLLPRQTPGDFTDDGVVDRVVYRPASGMWLVEGQAGVSWGVATDIPVPGDYNGDFRSDPAVFRPSTGVWYLRNIATVQFGQKGDRPVPADYDGDGRTDIAVFRPTNGTWYVRTSSSGYSSGFSLQWGANGDLPVPGDYDGDGDADLAVFRPANGAWYVRNGVTAQWGTTFDIPVPADYDGNGTTDIAVFRPTSATWYVLGQFTRQFGQPGDEPRPMDIDGDRRVELTTYRPSSSAWTHFNLSSAATTAVTFGAAGDLAPVGPGVGAVRRAARGDVDGDGLADAAVFDTTSGVWSIRGSATAYAATSTVAFGTANDIPLSGDFLGLGTEQLAVFRPLSGTWYVRGGPIRAWGTATDLPVPADFDGDGRTDLAVFRPSGGTWYVLTSLSNFTSSLAVSWGTAGDVPVPADWDRDGIDDMAVYRPSSGVWYLRRSRDGIAVLPAAVTDGTPLPWLGATTALTAMFRTAADTWSRADGGGDLGNLSTCGCWQAGAADRDGDRIRDLIGYDNGTWELRSSRGLPPITFSLGSPADVALLPR